jgi:hypothetical protein
MAGPAAVPLGGSLAPLGFRSGWQHADASGRSDHLITDRARFS